MMHRTMVLICITLFDHFSFRSNTNCGPNTVERMYIICIRVVLLHGPFVFLNRKISLGMFHNVKIELSVFVVFMNSFSIYAVLRGHKLPVYYVYMQHKSLSDGSTLD